MADTTGFSRPTLPAIIDRDKADFNARLSGSVGFLDARLRRSLNFVLANVGAAAAHSLYGFAEDIAKQVTPDTATTSNLERWASIWGITRLQAAKATGSNTFTGTPTTVIPALSEIQRGDDVSYITDALATIPGGGSIDVPVTASITGADGNAIAAVITELVTPIAGITSVGVVASGGITGGLDVETDAALLTRLLARLQDTPQGGSAADYEAWVLDAGIGVDRVFVNPLELGAGTVVVRLTVADTGSGVVPSAGIRTAAVAAIAAERPVTAIVTIPTPAVVEDAIDISVTLVPLADAVVEAAVEAQLAALWLRDAIPGGTIPNSTIRQAIGGAAGLTSFVLTDVDGGGGLADVVLAQTDIAINGVFTY